MTHSAGTQASELGVAHDTLCQQGNLALLALRTRYGLTTVDMTAMDRISASQVAATLEFLSNNLP